MMKTLGEHTKAIQDTWIDGDNLATYNKLINENKTKEAAAIKTFTGKMAERHGFTVVEDVKILEYNATGVPIKMTVIFKK